MSRSKGVRLVPAFSGPRKQTDRDAASMRSAERLSTGGWLLLSPDPGHGHGCNPSAANEVSLMPEIDQVRARLETACELTGLLVAAGEAFSLLLAACCRLRGTGS